MARGVICAPIFVYVATIYQFLPCHSNEIRLVLSKFYDQTTLLVFKEQHKTFTVMINTFDLRCRWQEFSHRVDYVVENFTNQNGINLENAIDKMTVRLTAHLRKDFIKCDYSGEREASGLSGSRRLIWAFGWGRERRIRLTWILLEVLLKVPLSGFFSVKGGQTWKFAKEHNDDAYLQ